MSDDWIRLVPDNPGYIPDSGHQDRARARFAEIAPDADIECEVHEKIEFFDCGGNFERVRCPSCGAELANDWWRDRMDDDFSDENGFNLSKYTMPCCKVESTLNDLQYEWAQAFGRFVLEAQTSQHGLLADEHKRELEEILGTKLRVVYQHL